MRSNRTLDPLVPWSVFMLATAAFAVAAGMFGLAHNWQPSWGAYGSFAFAGLYAYFGVRPVIEFRLSKNRHLRKILIALASQRQGEWLNRDEHLIFKARRVLHHPVQIWIIVRMNEDTLTEAETGAQTPVTYERFIFMPFVIPPYHFDEAALITAKDTGDVRELDAGKLPGEPGLFTYLRRNRQMSKAGLGPRPSTADEVRELIRQLEEAEFIGAEA
jgi:hypothetical protein